MDRTLKIRDIFYRVANRTLTNWVKKEEPNEGIKGLLDEIGWKDLVDAHIDLARLKGPPTSDRQVLETYHQMEQNSEVTDAISEWITRTTRALINYIMPEHVVDVNTTRKTLSQEDINLLEERLTAFDISISAIENTGCQYFCSRKH
jgi:hypothetical protein